MTTTSFKQTTMAISVALALGLSPAVQAVSCDTLKEEVKDRLSGLASRASDTESQVRKDHESATSAKKDYSKNYFQHFEDLNKSVNDAYKLVNTAYDLSSHLKPLAEGKLQTSLPKKVTHSMSNAVELAQAAMDEENTKLDLAELRCDQSTENTVLSAYLNQADSSTVSTYKTTKKTACKVVHILADLQDKREKLNDFRKNGYPLFYLHEKEKKSFNGKERTIQLKVDLRMYPEYPSKPVYGAEINGQPVLLGTLNGIDLSYNSYFKWSDNNWTTLNLFQYLISDTQKDEFCPIKIPITGSVKAKLCASVEDISAESIRIKVRGKYNYNSDWSAVSLGTHTIPAPFGYLADVSDMKEKKMQDLKSKLANRVASLFGEYSEVVKKAEEWQKSCEG